MLEGITHTQTETGIITWNANNNIYIFSFFLSFFVFFFETLPKTSQISCTLHGGTILKNRQPRYVL